jgi:hypothetical protein
MGLFDLFGSRETRERNQLRKLAKKVTQKYGPPENRQKVIEQLGGMGTSGALRVLCLRFTTRIDVGIQDDEEKERVRQILTAAGSAAVEPVKAFLRQQESGVALGLRVLTALVSPEEVVATVLELLRTLGGEYTRDPEKKLTLLTWLQEHPDLLAAAPAAGPTPEASLLPLLEDFTDDVRITAARTLARAPLAEASRDGLIGLLLRDRDNARVRGEVLEALAAHGADVKGHRPSVEALLVEPFFLDKEGRVKRRG